LLQFLATGKPGWSVTGASPGRMDSLGRVPWHRLIDVLEQRAELTQLSNVELGDRSDFSQIIPEIFDCALTALCKGDALYAPIIGIVAPFDVLTLFEAIDKRGES
jgi:hypothetical protein